MTADARPQPADVSELARALGCSRATVARHIVLGNLPAVNIGTRRRRFWRASPDALATFIATRSNNAQK